MTSLPKIGAVAGWCIDLGTTDPKGGIHPRPGAEKWSFASDQYRGSVDVTLSSGLDPGKLTVVVEDINEADYKELVGTAAKDGPLVARLWMYWDDARSIGTSFDPPVAVVRVTSLRRRAGQWRYELVIEGRDWVYDHLLGTQLPVLATGALDAAQQIAELCNIGYEPRRSPQGAQPKSTEQRTWGKTETARLALERMGDAMVEQAKAAGRKRGGLGMYLVSRGRLLIGPDRLDSITTATAVTASEGLLAIERTGTLGELDAKEIKEDDGKAKRRDLYALTLRGRPDLQPGDVIDIAPPESNGGIEDLGYALGPAPVVTHAANREGRVNCYIQEVSHRLTRAQGFLTVVRCVSESSDNRPTLADRLWFESTVADRTGEAGSAEARLASRLRTQSRERSVEVAQVRSLFVSGEDPPPQTEKLRRGLEGTDALTFAAARRAFAKSPELISAAPYATPFAWGKFGLVVPRYPGTRVLLVHRNGDPDDPVDVGALWERGNAPEAKAGDWWLSLPAQISTDARASVDDNRDPPAPTGKASNDLTDADGNRVIAVGKLTVKVGSNALLDAGTRPSVSDLHVSIEHSSGAKITIDQDGGIVIEAKKKLTLKGPDGIALETQKDISMKVGTTVAITKGA